MTTPNPGRIISGDREVSLDTVHRRALQAANGLASLGVGAGDTFAILLRNDFPFVEAALAGNRLGAHLVPINWHFSGPEVGYILSDSGARALIAHADLLTRMRDHIPDGVAVFVVPTPPEICAVYGIGLDRAARAASDTDWSTIEPTEHKGDSGVAIWRTRTFGCCSAMASYARRKVSVGNISSR